MKDSLLFYPIRLRVVWKLFGYLCLCIGAASFVPFLISLIFKEFELSISYFFVCVVSLILGGLLRRLPEETPVQANEGVAVICFSYLYAGGISAIPLMAGGLTFFDALFESFSGITTTGLSMITDWSQVPKTTLFSRAWLQWIGGLGIVIFSLALLFRQGEVTKKLSLVEADSEDLGGGSRAYARGILQVYSSITALGVLIMILAGTEFFPALMLMLAAVSTGGFSPYPDSIASLSLLQQTVLLFFAFICAVSLPFYYKVWRDRLSMSLEGFQIFGLIILASLLSLSLGSTVDSWILGFSAQTTTGFSTEVIETLPAWKKLLLSLLMLVGGGVGSTAGGFKILRLYLCFLFVRTFIIRQSQTRHAYYQPKIFGMKVPEEQWEQGLSIVCFFGFFTSISWLCFVVGGYDPINSLFEVASAMGTVGLSSGITSPDLPLFLKGVLMGNMLLGRVEIFPWLILLYPGTWLGQQRVES